MTIATIQLTFRPRLEDPFPKSGMGSFQTRNPKPEVRMKSEARNDEREPLVSSFGFRHSDLIRISGFELRVSISGFKVYAPATTPLFSRTSCLAVSDSFWCASSHA